MPRILVVDDELDLRTLVATVLTMEGHSVEVAADGIEALDALTRDMPDLVLLDLSMPRMDGWRFIDELYGRDLRARTRVVIMSGHDVVPVFAEDGRPAARWSLTKPFDAETLVDVVERLLREPPHAIIRSADRSDELVMLMRDVDRVLARGQAGAV